MALTHLNIAKCGQLSGNCMAVGLVEDIPVSYQLVLVDVVNSHLECPLLLTRVKETAWNEMGEGRCGYIISDFLLINTRQKESLIDTEQTEGVKEYIYLAIVTPPGKKNTIGINRRIIAKQQSLGTT